MFILTWSQNQHKTAYFQHEFYKECRKIKGFNGSIPYKPLFMRGSRILKGEKWLVCDGVSPVILNMSV